MKCIKPNTIKKGDVIAIISPSSPMAGLTPHRLENAKKFLESEGFKVKEFASTRVIRDWSAGTPEERAKDIMDAFLDPEVKAIICAIGGSTANQTLKYLDFEKIKNNPKIFCGYSDITTFTYAFHTKSNLMSFYGPSALVQLGEFPKPLAYTWDYFKKATMTNEVIDVKASKEWTDETINWFTKEDLTRPRKMKPNKGFIWLHEGFSEGEIIGGCLIPILNLAGTEYWPDYRDKILFLEIPEGSKFDIPTPVSEVDFRLTHLEMLGVFDEIKGLIFGRPYAYNDEDFFKLKEVVAAHTKGRGFPVLYNVDIGHTDPQITVPVGATVKLDSKNNLFQIKK
jgi:muramoyltetrapeptide carboxypeptidase